MRTARVHPAVQAGWSGMTSAQKLTDLAARSTHLALMVHDPYGVLDPLTVEAPISRVAVSWTAGPLLLRNTNLLAWYGLPSGSVVVAIAGFSAAFNGEMSFALPRPPLHYPSGGGLVIDIDDLYVGLAA